MIRCFYETLYAETNDDKLVIRDAGDHSVYKTITNDAENLVKFLHNSQTLRGRKLFYYDSAGHYAEILHDNAGNFLDFKFAKNS